MAGVARDAGAAPEGLISGEEWGPPGEGSVEMARPPPQKKNIEFFGRNGVFLG